jgi:hypothetical protein
MEYRYAAQTPDRDWWLIGIGYETQMLSHVRGTDVQLAAAIQAGLNRLTIDHYIGV